MAGSLEPLGPLGPRARTALLDVAAQAWAAVTGRPLRSLLTAAGVALGVAAAVATIGVTASAAAAISDRFDAARATEVTLRYPEHLRRPPGEVVAAVRRLNGVEHAGLLCQARQGETRASAVAGPHTGDRSVRLHRIALQPEALAALGATVESGRIFDDGHGARREPVALLDSVAARELGIAEAAGQIVYLEEMPVSVIGIYRAPRGDARLTAAVAVPYQVCQEDEPSFRPAEVVIRTALGAATQVSVEARLAIHPTGPAELVAVVPPELRTFQRGVEDDTRALFLGLAAVSMLMGALGVFNTTLVSVIERRGEIGLRRAIGASRRAVAGQFLLESGLLGLAGGLAGTIVAIDAVAAVALARSWLIVLPPGLVVAGPVLGVLVGILAGGYPAWVASRVVPADTLRAG